MKTFNTSREIEASVEKVFAAFDPERLPRWWGPAGFTNTSHICEVKTGGRWSLIMHGPNGVDYPNEYLFTEVEALKKVIIEHIQEPKFSLAINLSPSAKGTLVTWAQTFESSDVADKIEHIVVPANEQNLDKLVTEVIKGIK